MDDLAIWGDLKDLKVRVSNPIQRRKVCRDEVKADLFLTIPEKPTELGLTNSVIPKASSRSLSANMFSAIGRTSILST